MLVEKTSPAQAQITPANLNITLKYGYGSSSSASTQISLSNHSFGPATSCISGSILPAGQYILPTGIAFYSNGAGATCSYLNKLSPSQLAAATSIATVPPTNECPSVGYCNQSQVLAAGQYVLPNGLEFYANGSGATCSYQSRLSIQALSIAVDLPSLPNGNEDPSTGICDGGGVLAAGIYILPSGVEFYANGQGATCSYTTRLSSSQLTSATFLPYLPPGNEAPSIGFCNGGGILASGQYILPSGAAFYSNGSGATCLYASALTPAELSTATSITAVPPGNEVPTGYCEGNFVSVKTYGAVGDGLTDDTVAIQSAINASNNVYFPSGVYAISSSIQLKQSSSYFGAGANQSILRYVGPTNQTVLNLNGTTGSSIHDLGVLGTSGPTTTITGIGFGNSSQNVVYNVYVSNFWNECVSLSGSDNTIRDSDLESCKVVLGATGNGHTIQNNYISNHYLSSSEPKPWTSASSYWDGIEGEGLSNSLISGNTSIENGQSGIYTGGNNSVSFGNTIQNNYVAHNWNRGIDQGVTGDVSSTNSLSNITITGNVSIDNREPNLWLNLVQQASVSQNYLEYTTDYSSLFGSYGESTRLSIFLDEYLPPCDKGVPSDELTNVTVQNNTILDNQHALCMSFSVLKGKGSVITQNTMNCGFWYPSQAAVGNTLTAQNNLCSN